MKISIAIPLYNKRDTILRALFSVFNQTIQPEEIIVVNDGSTDGSGKIVTDLNHPLVRFFSQSNAGVSAARNRGIAEAKGDWIAFLDADDFWDNDYLETVTNINKKYPEADLIFTSYRYFDNFGISLPKHEFGKNEGILSNYFKHAYHGSPPIWTGAVCVSKVALEHVGLFPVNVKLGEDLLTWAKLALEYKIAYTGSIKSNYFFPSKVNSTTEFRLPEDEDVIGNELKKLFSSIQVSNTKRDFKNYISHWHKMRLHLFIYNKKKDQRNAEYLKCIHFNPLNYKAHLLYIFSLLPDFLKAFFEKKMNKSLQ